MADRVVATAENILIATPDLSVGGSGFYLIQSICRLYGNPRTTAN